MANKKYVIMQRQPPEPGELSPVVSADNNKEIKQFQNGGYKIVGRVSCNEGLRPTMIGLKRQDKN